VLNNALFQALQTIRGLPIGREKRSVANRTGSTKFHSAHNSVHSLIAGLANFNPITTRCDRVNLNSGSPSRSSGICPTHKRGRHRLAIGAAPDTTPALAALRVNPGYSIDDQKRSHVVTHRLAALDYPSFMANSSFLFGPRHSCEGDILCAAGCLNSTRCADDAILAKM
jgi:hypothetical protein